MKINVSRCFRDITTSFINDYNSDNYKVIDAKTFTDSKGNVYHVDGKNVCLDYSINEKETAVWLGSLFGGLIIMLPKVNIPIGVKTADYLFNGEFWDLKEITGTGKNVFFHAVENSERQSHNFVFDVSSSKLTDQEVFDRIYKLYNLPKLKWLDKVIIKRNNSVLKVLKRSDPSD